jgi:hypothetical protein
MLMEDKFNQQKWKSLGISKELLEGQLQWSCIQESYKNYKRLLENYVSRIDIKKISKRQGNVSNK